MKFYPLLFIYFSFIFADIPYGYYDSVSGLSGDLLKSALHDIIDDHEQQNYGSLHDHFEITDIKTNNTVWDMYSDVPNSNSAYTYYFIDSDQCGNYSEEGDCYNREHSWPQSWFNSAFPMKSDLFHVYPTDGYVNSHRGSLPYGDVDEPTWTSTNGSKKGTCSNPGFTGMVFEPINEYKGDFARTYFYMSTRYYSEDYNWDNTEMTNGADLKNWAIDVLINWHHLDTISEKELNRNDIIYEIQGNRNPFIDHPEWVDCIWDNHCITYGCTDSEANNYNPFATEDNGSCEYELSINSIKDSLIKQYHLLPAYPNPFNPKTTISFSLPENCKIQIQILDLNGNLVNTLISEKKLKGNHSIIWNADELKNGIYFIKLSTSKYKQVQKISLVK